MSKAEPSPIITATAQYPAPAVIAHTYVRLHGVQTANLTVHHARTDAARVALNWGGGVLMTFFNARAAQGVLEGVAAARATLVYLPTEVHPMQDDPYEAPTVAIDWKHRPQYAAVSRSSVTPDQRRTVKWTDIYMGPITIQVLDRAAYHSATAILREAHRTAVAVCLDGPEHDADPTRDDYRPPR
ncbi:hypothetical protein BTO20_37575 (plasmid) [Mycobacterium dioxanotrophicus]|jgi:hypothetical protein|uniref:Uncharacterized protein n=1 Tax=Mycobacterium dioxanotrophicus TaxID=482462 RepID=A0A1Y0CH99_9MYCO|nr:hypothetical protein [Mycobacterium dioxanotrophicus]ART74336.1 hypothetical protein BTO20_37575 [Mycobacterium dioxanotrophicus]